MKPFHPPYNSDVFSAVESRKELDAYEDIIVGKDPESTRHRCLAGWELARIRRTNPSPDIIGLTANRRADVEGLKGVDSVSLHCVTQGTLRYEAGESVRIELGRAYFVNAKPACELLH